MQIRTDLAMESRAQGENQRGVVSRSLRYGEIEEYRVTVCTKEAAKELGKDCGQYVTLCHPSLPTAPAAVRDEMARSLAETLRKLTPPFGEALVVGLGNRRITADALGSRVLESLLVTRHMKDMTEESLRGRLRGVSALAPGVLGVTGLETAEVIKGVTNLSRPACVIAIDALAARESGRICTTIQITDTGIRPGSGVGNHRMGLTRETLGVPVIAIGVPMVVYASVIARDALTLMMEDMGLGPGEHEQAVESLVEKVTAKRLGEMVVTPREVDSWVGTVAEIIAKGLNMALQPRLSNEEIYALSHDSL